jgi:hypothetical protein
MMWTPPVLLFFILPLMWHNDLGKTPLKACYTIYILHRDFIRFIMIPIVTLIFAGVIMAYIPILQTDLRVTRSMRTSPADSSSFSYMRSQLKILKTATMVLFPCFASWLPWCLTASSIVYSDKEYHYPDLKFKVVRFLPYLVIIVPIVNPLIYASRMPEFRTAFKSMLIRENAVAPAAADNPPIGVQLI